MKEIRHLVTTDFGQMHLRCRGDVRQQPLLLLHMSPRSSRMWRHLQDALERPSIAPDRLGYGYSDRPARELTLEQYAQATLQAVSALGATGQLDVLGMHTGAIEAVQIGVSAAARVRKLGIVAIPLFTAAERTANLQSFGEQRIVPRQDGSHLQEIWANRFQYRTPPYDLADVQERTVDYLNAPFPGQAYQAVFRFDLAECLLRLRRPIVAFVPRDDLYDVSLRARGSLPPGSTFVDLPDCGIDLFLRDVPRMAALLSEYFPVDR
ncbi:MAG: alpha/beta hydrolase [Steroidobacteraceae bacterium]